jgi:hypothetical protein
MHHLRQIVLRLTILERMPYVGFLTRKKRRLSKCQRISCEVIAEWWMREENPQTAAITRRAVWRLRVK